MKNVTKILALSLVVVMAALTLVACGADFAKMEEKLEAEGYDVTYFDEKKLEDPDKMTTAEKITYGLVTAMVGEDVEIKGALVATKSFSSNVFVIEFKNAEDAEKIADKSSNAIRDGKVVYIGDAKALEIVR